MYQLPPERLNPTPDERKLLTSVVDDMLAVMLRQQITRRPDDDHKYMDTWFDTDQPTVASLDKIIAAGMDRLRPVIAKDFYEKAFDEVEQRVDQSPRDHAFWLWYRMAQTMAHITVVTKRRRGQSHPGYVDMVSAKSQAVLKERGLWKSR